MKESTVDILFLSEEEMIKSGVLDMSQCVKVVDEVFQILGRGDSLMGGPSGMEHGHMLYFPSKAPFPHMPQKDPNRRFMAMIGYLGGRFGVAGEKWYGANLDNDKIGLPRSIHLVILNDAKTGKPLAIMSGNLISAMRTGAVAGVGAKYGAKKDAEVLGLVGCGVINKGSLKAFKEVLPSLKLVKVFDVNKEKGAEFCHIYQEELKITFKQVETLEEAVSSSDVINLATSGPACPAIKKEWLKNGSLLSLPAGAILDEDLLLSSRIIADEWKMHKARFLEEEELPESDSRRRPVERPRTLILQLIKEGKLSEDTIINLSSVAIGQKKARENNEENVILIMGGLSLFDLGFGYHVYQNALQNGLGTKLRLWDEPSWF